MKKKQEKINDALVAKANARPTVSLDNVEPPACDASLGAEEIPRLDTPCRIHVRSFRHRLADSDGISAKAAIDGLVHAGILPDDSALYVEEVCFYQEKISKDDAEHTEIEISWGAGWSGEPW